VSNAWKKWQGIILGLTRNKAVDLKLAEEEAFRTWLAADGERQMKYGELLDDFSLLYGELEQYSVAMDLMTESIMAVELHRQLRRVQQMMGRGAPADQIRSAMDRFYKDYHPPLDEECYAAMMEAYSRQIPKAFKPAFLQEAEQDHQGDFSSFAREVYKKALLNQPDKFESFLSLYEKKPAAAQKKLDKDPLAKYLKEVMDIYRGSVIAEVSRIQRELDQNYKLYMAALREQSENVLYPDANFTMRLTYGKVNDYDPRDGVEYRHYTTLAGVMDKEREGFEDYAVPDKLRELFEANDFGPYGVDGTMPVCFTATNHTSGGNSGSPVMDADGRLIGINFDRNWEGTMSDVHYDPKLCRNISVDIRYVLFIIDKYAGAGYLLEEMDIHW